MTPLSTRRAWLVLAAGLLVFIAAKGFYITAQTAAMGMPRLGDDAYTHLWRAKEIDDTGVVAALTGDRQRAPRAVRDIAHYCGGNDVAATDGERAACARLVFNVMAPDPYAGASVVLNALLKLGLPPKWTYALHELAIMLVIAGGLAFFLFRLAGPAAAGVALVFMAFANLLPPQGLHQFIPSTLVIGLSLALWGWLLGRTTPLRFVAAGLCVLALSRVHPVALVYGAGLVVIALPGLWRVLGMRTLAVVMTGVTLAACAFLWLFDPLHAIVARALAGNLAAIAAANLAELPERLGTFAQRNWGIVAAFCASAALWRRALNPRTALAGAVLLILLGAAMFYRTEFYIHDIPLDLFARVFVGFAVVVCAAVALSVVELAAMRGVWPKALAMILVVLVPIPSVLPWLEILASNINTRMEVIDERRLSVDRFGRDATIAYGELVISPMVLFLAGAHDRGAIPMSGMSSEALRQAFALRRPVAVVMPNFRALNSLAAAYSRSLERRRHGFAAAVADLVTVSARAPVRTLYLRLRNGGDAAVEVGPNWHIAADGRPQRLPDLVAPPGSDAWVPVQLPAGSPARAVHVHLPPSPLWILGIQVNVPPRAEVNWPWDSEATVEWRLRDRVDTATVAMEFSILGLFRAWRVHGIDLLPDARGGQVIADEGGLVLISTARVAQRQ